MKKSSLIPLALLSLGFVSCGDPSNIASGISSGSEVSSISTEEGSSDDKASSTKAGASSSSKISTSSGSEYWNTDIPYDSITDDRDDQVYRTVKIGTQTWLAENLNYTPELGYSWCYDRKNANCDTYGRLYDWNTAKTACPDGWSLPDSTDWNTLVTYAGSKVSAGVKLKAATTLWGVNKGTDAFGFSAIPSGLYDGDLYFDLGVSGTWWTATSASNTEAYINDMLGTSAATRSGKLLKTTGAAVRCIQDEVPVSSSVKASSSVKPTSSAALSSSETVKSSEAVSSSVKASSSAGLSSIAIVSSPIQISLTIPVSSSAKVSSSTAAPSSSSTCTNTYTATTVKDCRDGKVYKTTMINGQTWLGQNMNFKTASGSYCYGDATSCDTYGRMYDWANAQVACPTNWHLPDSTEWKALITYAGGSTTAAKKLKSTSTSMWGSTGAGTDDFGFTALPGGKYYEHNAGSMSYQYQTDSGYWWTSSAIPNTTKAMRYSMLWGSSNVYGGPFNIAERVSVRCIRN